MKNPRPLPTTTRSSSIRRVAFAGDWHADLRFAKYAIHRVGVDVDAIIHVGDFGYDMHPGFIKGVSTAAGRCGLIVVFVDGNHDNHTWLRKQRRGIDGSVQLAEHVWYLPRGFRWEWDGVTFLAVGGAVSIDRPWRQEAMRAGAPTNWWPGEELSPADITAAVTGGRVDVMVTHDAPSGVLIPGIGENEHLWDPSMLAESKDHQRLLRGVVDQVRPRFLWHGHFHTRYRAVLDLGAGDSTQVTGLGHEGTGTAGNLDVVNLHDLRAASAS